MLQGWLGVWILTAVFSNGSTAPRLYTRVSRHIQRTDSTITIVEDLVRIRGGIAHTEWTGKFDGKDYPVQGVEVYLTSAYRQVDDHTLEQTQKLDGRPVVHSTLVLSADATTIKATTTDGSTTVQTVYTKR